MMTIVNLASLPEHLPTLAAWHQAQWAELNPGQSLDQRIQKMQAYLHSAALPSTYVYLHDGELAGSAALVACDMDTRPQLTPWLASVFVAPAFRRQSIGSRLVRHVMQQAKLAGYERLYLFTPDRADFYRRLGWGELRQEVYRGHAVTVMQADLLAIRRA